MRTGQLFVIGINLTEYIYNADFFSFFFLISQKNLSIPFRFLGEGWERLGSLFRLPDLPQGLPSRALSSCGVQ